jgi:RNA polymerase sigma-70 factor, ECF subfamily
MMDATALFYEHIWPHRAMVVRTARFLAQNDAEADDLAQETLVKAFKNIWRFDPATNAKFWLSSILRHTWIDHLRASGRHGTMLAVEDLEGELEDKTPVTEADLQDAEALLERFSDKRILLALKELPAEIRWTILLVDVESLDHAAAAAILGVPVGTVKSRAHRGRNMMRKNLMEGQENSEGRGIWDAEKGRVRNEK